MLKAERISFSIHVDYGTSIEDMLVAGEYDWHDPKISSKTFPRRRCGRAEVYFELLSHQQIAGAPNIESGIRSLGLEPTELHELLAVGNFHRDMMYEFMIFAAGSPTGRFGRVRIPFLYSNYDAREVGLGSVGGHVSERWRFAGVRRIPILTIPEKKMERAGVLSCVPVSV